MCSLFVVRVLGFSKKLSTPENHKLIREIGRKRCIYFLGLALIFSAILLLCTACLRLPVPPPLPASEQACNAALDGAPPQVEPAKIQVAVWAQAYGEYCWRSYGLLQAVAALARGDVQVIPHTFRSVTTPYLQAFEAAAAAGHAPDIVHGGAGELQKWQAAGYLMPLDECRHRHPNFAGVRDELWQMATVDGQVWGVPFEVGFHYFLFNKQKLRALGWSEAQITNLPQQIEAGTFTLDDLRQTAQQAIDAGVVRPGFGYWPSMLAFHNFFSNYIAHGGEVYNADEDKLLISRRALAQTYAFRRTTITEQLTLDFFAKVEGNHWVNENFWHDALIHNRVLFWRADIHNWSGWIENYFVPQTPAAELSDTIGYALYPSATRNTPGAITWTTPNFYMITAPTAAARTDTADHAVQDAACALLAEVITPQINSANAARARHMSVLKVVHVQQLDRPGYFPSKIMRLWPYARHVRPQHSQFPAYEQTLLTFMQQAMQGELSPTAAADAAIADLQTQLGNELIIIE